MRKYHIYIDHEIGNAISCAAYLTEGQRDVIVRIISNPDIKINLELFEYYERSYIENYMYLEELKAKMENDYLGVLKQTYNCEWNLTYSTRELVVSVLDTDKTNEEIDEVFRLHGYERID